MDRNEAIEIPFGAKDSELKGWEYTIPEGMEAVIKDGKIIVREKESEDEKIRKEIIGFLNAINKDTLEGRNFIADRYGDAIPDDMIPTWIAWLEKQGEQNLDNPAKTYKDEQNPAWSEKDEKNLQFAIDDFQSCVDNNQFPVVYNTEQHKEVLALLKSLKERYTWKPSDEQMEVLNEVINYAAGHQSIHWNDYLYNILKQFKNQLEKLKG